VTGLPVGANVLIGDEYVKFASGHQANLAAEAISALAPNPVGTNASATTATLRFDGVSYNRLPRVLAADNIPSAADNNSTLLIVDRVGGNFTSSGSFIGNLNGVLFNDTETLLSFTANIQNCQLRSILSNNFPRTFTPFNRFIQSGASGWMKFWSVDDAALFGVQINFNPNAATNGGAFNQGHNLHKLTLTDAATIVVPIFNPSCQ